MIFSFFASCAKNIENLLQEELVALGIQNQKATVAGVYFQGSLELAYRVCLWTRLANHIFLKLSEFDAMDGDQLYEAVKAIDWSEHLTPENTFCLEVTGQHSSIKHPIYIIQRAKDAIVDQFRDRFGTRPSVTTDRPAVCINFYVENNHFIVNINLSGESLHRRGYRLEGGKAPLKETLAAALLYRAGWRQQLQQSPVILYDPFCGSGTLLIEAALIAFDIAPGLKREYFGFIGWKQHNTLIWEQLKSEAAERKLQGLTRQEVIIYGSDSHPLAITTCLENIRRAGLEKKIVVQQQDCKTISILPSWQKHTGLIITNPPYGERLHTNDDEVLHQLFKDFGERLKEGFLGWQTAIFSGAPQDCLKSLGIRAKHYYHFFNGPLACRLYLFTIQPEYIMLFEEPAQKLARKIENIVKEGLSVKAMMLANRIRKNIKNLQSWLKRSAIECYRIYDADLPEYAVAIDFYQQTWLQVQEYQAPKEIDPKKAEKHLLEVLAVLHQELRIPTSHIYVKVRKRQKGDAQYQKLDSREEFVIIQEWQAKFWVNFVNYLDTGIFLDHRLVRQKIAQASKDKMVLNLFAYTCTASVEAALYHAAKTINVDLSNTYLEWGKRNFKLNNLLLAKHEFIQADCLQWLQTDKNYYEVIFLNPPSFSNSKRMQTVWDIDKDHVKLLQLAMNRLKKDGVLFFSCNLHNFKLKIEQLSAYNITDISQATLAKDFIRSAKSHHVWEFRHK